MQVHHQQFRGLHVFWRKLEDQLRQRRALVRRVSDMGRLDELIVQSVCEEWVG